VGIETQMKITQLTEVKLAERKPQYSGLSDDKVIQLFFDEDLEQSNEAAEEYDPNDSLYGVRYFHVKDGLVVYDNKYGEILSNVQLYPSRGKKKGKWATQDHEAETEWEVKPSKFKVDMTQAVYR